MGKQLRATPWLHAVNARRMYIGLYILCLMIGGAAFGQPAMVSEISKASKNFTSVNSRLYYTVADSLFSASATSAPTLVKTTEGQPILRLYNIALGGSFFFVTQNGSGQSLWRTDGTASGTVQIATQNEITPLLTYHSQLFMRVKSASSGVELWKVDGAYNASMVKDVNPGTANGFSGFSIAIHNDFLYFFGSTNTTSDLWRSDGTTSGTAMAVDLDDAVYYNSSQFYGLASVNNIMFFTRNYEGSDYGDRIGELWKTDGTQSGTVMIQSTSSNQYNEYDYFLPFNGKLYFFHHIGDPAYTYLSVSDGTSAGTTHIELVSIDGWPRPLMAAGSYFLYHADSQGYVTPIKKSDGTTSAVVHSFSDYFQGTEYNISLTYTNGRAFFVDDVDDYEGTEKPRDSQLWQADLATSTTRPVQDIWNIPLPNSGNIVADNGNVFFTRLISNHLTLWYYNPNTPPNPSTCENAGYIEREKWNNLTGYSVSSIPVTTQPSLINVLSNFSTHQNDGDNYGSRVRGYICPPQTGNYVFYISSDDNSELWLSTDDNPANKKLIASSKWTNYNEWNKYPTQQSAEIPLVVGTTYYIEALHKEATGADHLSVGWRLPNATLERPIPGIRLIPFKRNSAPNVFITKPADNDIFTAPATIDLGASSWDPDGTVVKVAFYNGANLLAEIPTTPNSFTYTYKWSNVPQGNYTIEARATDNQGFTKSDFQTVTVSPGCSGTGRIYREFWVNVPDQVEVYSFTYNQRPTGSPSSFTSFETDQYHANNYVSRMRGWLCVPQTGNYTLWISSDDGSELYLSTDDTETNKKLIAYVSGATPFRNYDKYPSQKSSQIFLQAGRKYYVEARQRERTGNDFISVGWQLPDGTMERPIPGNRIIALEPTYNEPPTITITSPQPNQNFTSPASVRFAANVTDPDGVKQVKFVVLYGSTTTTLATFTAPPYEYQWNNVPSGSYQFLVEADDPVGAGTSKSIFFTVDKSACTGTGTIVREIWTGISGTSVSSIPVNSPPNKTVTLSSFSTPNYYGNDYGSRIRGYVCAPMTGQYRFWISSDDNSELWLSDNDDPATKQKIAYVIGATAVNQWTKYPSQESHSVTLVQGQRYYIEVLHKEGGGADHVEVGWELPSNNTLERPIPGNRLIPFNDPATFTAGAESASLLGNMESDAIALYPNPTSSRQTTLTLSPEAMDNSSPVKVEVISTTGRIVQTQELDCSENCSDVLLSVDDNLPSGVYMVSVYTKGRKFGRRLIVK